MLLPSALQPSDMWAFLAFGQIARACTLPKQALRAPSVPAHAPSEKDPARIGGCREPSPNVARLSEKSVSIKALLHVACSLWATTSGVKSEAISKLSAFALSIM